MNTKSKGWQSNSGVEELDAFVGGSREIDGVADELDAIAAGNIGESGFEEREVEGPAVSELSSLSESAVREIVDVDDEFVQRVSLWQM
jgi:hypothetical protein